MEKNHKLSLARIVELVTVASVIVLTVAWLALLVYGVLALFDWIAG